MPDQPWYREWRDDELAREGRLAADKQFRRREKAKQFIGRTLLVGAIVMMFWSIKEAFG